MTERLITALMEKNAFVKDTVITADYQLTDIFGRTFNKVGDFKIKTVTSTNSNSYAFELINLQEVESSIKTDYNSIKAIDGMDLVRFADIYDLHIDGTSKKVNRKRGRKPKIRN